MTTDRRVHFSDLKYMARSPAHYLQRVMDPSEPTPQMKLGTLVDMLIFGGNYAVYTDGVRRGKKWEDWKRGTLETKGEDCEIFIPSEIEHAESIAASVKANDLAMALLSKGERQRKIHWEFLGRACSSKPDTFTTTRVVELKTANDGRPDKFQRDAIRMGYHAQLAFYGEAIRRTGLGDPGDYGIVCAETSPPYVVTIHKLTPRAIDAGMKCCFAWMEQVKACERSGVWPGYSDAVVTFDVPDDDLGLIIGEETI
jgi:hypothetical protein